MTESFHDILTRALVNAECHVRPMYFNEREDAGILRVTTSDDLIYTVHYNASEK